jgi:glycine/D-amino acid oxidase-like deaminating enzyme
VIGAGICGLGAAYELSRRGADVTVLERAGVGAEQSAGLARIFRIAHMTPRLASLAAVARDGWRRWEDELGAGRLLGEEGLVLAGPEAADRRAAAMDVVGARWEALDGAGIAAHVPIVGASPEWTSGLLDPQAGAIRVRRTLRALAARLAVRIADVSRVDPSGAVVLADGSQLRADHVLVCAGQGTQPLGLSAGIDMELEFFHHVRLSYAGAHVLPSACLVVAGNGYGLPLGTSGRFAMGLEDPTTFVPVDAMSIDEYAPTVYAQHAEWIPANLPGLDPTPVDEVRCVFVHAPYLDADTDGFAARRNDRVTAFSGNNLMKFGPLIGERLASTVLDYEGDAVHPDLVG